MFAGHSGIDCGAHGSLAAGDICTCGCSDGYSGDRCQIPPLPAGLAEAYIIEGAVQSSRNGRYDLAGECNGKPGYMNQQSGCKVLFQPTNHSDWMVSTGNHLDSCDNSGWIHSTGSCAASPDGAGCAGLWKSVSGNCGSSWCDADALHVACWNSSGICPERSGQPLECTANNFYDDATNDPGACAGLIASGTLTCADDFDHGGQYQG